MQTLPFVAFVLTSLQLRRTLRVRLVLVAASSYAALYVILLMQALAGVPLVATDSTALVVWALASTLAAGTAWVRLVRVRSAAAA
jgi:hypothetical protein